MGLRDTIRKRMGLGMKNKAAYTYRRCYLSSGHRLLERDSWHPNWVVNNNKEAALVEVHQDGFTVCLCSRQNQNPSLGSSHKGMGFLISPPLLRSSGLHSIRD